MASRKSKKVYVKRSRSGKLAKRSKKMSNRRSGPIKKRVSRVSKVNRKSKYTKSGKLRLKSSRKGKRASERTRRASRGCSRQFTKKYSQRNSPPYPANNCCGSVKRGNDRKIYKSIQRTKASPCVWKRVAMN